MSELDAVDGFARLPEAGRLTEKNPAPAQLSLVVMMENLHEGPLHDHFVERRRHFRGRLAEMIRRSQAAGRVRKDVDAAAEAVDLCAYLDGLISDHLLDPEKVSVEAGLRRYVGRMLAAIGTDPS